MNADRESKPPRRRWFWRGALVGIAVLVLVRWQLLQTMIVPTDSMQPYLNGDPESGDRIAVLKNAHRWDPPARFDPVVFERQNNGEVQYLVKRAVAFGGETVRLEGGDLYAGTDEGNGPPLLRKSFADLNRVRVLLCDEPMDDGLPERFDLAKGCAEAVGDGWRFHGNGDAKERLDCRYAQAPGNGYLDREGQTVPGTKVVTDLMLEVTLVPEGADAGLVVQLREGMDRFHFFVQGPTADAIGIEHLPVSGETLSLREPDAARTLGHSGFPAGVPVTITVWNVDQSLGVAVNGAELLTVPHAAVDEVALQLQEGPCFGVFGGPAVVQGVRLFRDLHYSSRSDDGPRSWSVPAGHLFMLGDHSEASVDSRDFGPVPIEDLVGRPWAVCWPPERFRRLR